MPRSESSQRLSDEIRRAAEALPGMKVDLAAFEAHLLRSSRGEDLNVGDLLLAWASLRQDPVASRELERRLGAVARPILARYGDEHFADEVIQDVRERLLVGARPKLGAYGGRGALVQYLKAVVSSAAIDRVRRKRPASPGDDPDAELMRLASGERGQESQLFQRAGKAEFSRAFKEALAALGPEDRTLLRMKYVDGLAVEEIGRSFQVHRTTAMRWLERIQRDILQGTRDRLKASLGVGEKELDSLLRELELSFSERISRMLPALSSRGQR